MYTIFRKIKHLLLIFFVLSIGFLLQKTQNMGDGTGYFAINTVYADHPADSGSCDSAGSTSPGSGEGSCAGTAGAGGAAGDAGDGDGDGDGGGCW